METLKNNITTYYIVQYNDRYGNGNNKYNECIVESKEDFKRWLNQYNEERVEEGEEEEGEEEFDLLRIDLFK